MVSGSRHRGADPVREPADLSFPPSRKPAQNMEEEILPGYERSQSCWDGELQAKGLLVAPHPETRHRVAAGPQRAGRATGRTDSLTSAGSASSISMTSSSMV